MTMTEEWFQAKVAWHDELELWNGNTHRAPVARSIDESAIWAAEMVLRRGRLVSVLEPGDMTGYQYMLIWDQKIMPFGVPWLGDDMLLFGSLLNCGGAGGGLIPEGFIHPDYFSSHFMGPGANVHTAHVMARFFDLVATIVRENSGG